MDFHGIWYWRILQNIVKQCQFSFRLDEFNNDYMKAYMYFRQLLLERKMFQTKVVEKAEAHILHSVHFLHVLQFSEIIKQFFVRLHIF
jgi:hypothetical protein